MKILLPLVVVGLVLSGFVAACLSKFLVPTEDYFNQQLQLVTGDSVPYQFFIVSQPVSVSTPYNQNVAFHCAVTYTKNVDDLRFTWYVKRSGQSNFVRFGTDTLGAYYSNSSSFNSVVYSGMSIYCSITDGTTTINSDIVTLFYTGSSKSSKNESDFEDSEVFYDFQFADTEVINDEKDTKFSYLDEVIEE